MSLSDYTSISSEQIDLLASTLSKQDMQVIDQSEPIADFEELLTFTQEHPTPIVFTEQHPAWRLESVAARTIEAIAIATHEPLNELGWKTISRILIEHAEYLYTFPDERSARGRLTACTALAFVGCICSSIQESELWRLAGFGRIALTLNEVPLSPSDTHITHPLKTTFSLANALNLPILDTAIELYNSVLECNFTSKRALKFPMGDEDFLQYLNLDYLGLQDVKSTVSASETGIVISEYTAYRERYVRSFEGISDLHQTESFETVKLYLEYLLRLSIYPSPAIYGTTELAIATLLLPELHTIEQLSRMVTRRYKWIFDSFFYPDGFHKDRSFRSHIDSISNFSRFLKTYDKVKDRYQFSWLDEMETLLDKQMEACIYLRQPDLCFPPIAADTQECKFGGSDSIKCKRQNASYSLPYTGYYVMRSGWESDAHYLFFDGGMNDRSGSREKLSFLLYANGRQLITHEHNSKDSQNTPYNVVLIDGERQQSESAIVPDPDARWISTFTFDFVEGWYKSSDYQHKRSIFYIKDQYFILHDLIIGEGEHLIEQCFHLSKNFEEINMPYIMSDVGQVLTLEQRQSDLLIGSIEMPNLSIQYVGNRLKYQTKCELPVNMNVVLFPTKRNIDQHPSINTIPVETDDDVLASGFTVKSDYGTDIFLISDDGYAYMSAVVEGKRIEFKGEYLFLRGERFVMLNGQYLKVGSKELVALDEPCEYYEKL